MANGASSRSFNMKIKVYTIVSVFQGEGSIREQGTDRDKIREKFKEQVEDGYYYGDYSENTDEYYGDNCYISFVEKTIEV